MASDSHRWESTVDFRVVTRDRYSKVDMERTVSLIVNRLPKDGIDLSDTTAIERFVKNQENCMRTEENDESEDGQ